MCRHPELYRLQADMNCSELTVTAELVTKGTRVLVSEHAGVGVAPSQRHGGVGEAESFPAVLGSWVWVLLALSVRVGLDGFNIPT